MQEITWNRTDLIDETAEVVFQSNDRLKENLSDERGIKIEEWQQNRVKITKVEVNAIGEEKVHKNKERMSHSPFQHLLLKIVMAFHKCRNHSHIICRNCIRTLTLRHNQKY